MLHRLFIALTQVNMDNFCHNLLQKEEICILSLSFKQITKNNKEWFKKIHIVVLYVWIQRIPSLPMFLIYSEPHRLNRSKEVQLSNLGIYFTLKN